MKVRVILMVLGIIGFLSMGLQAEGKIGIFVNGGFASKMKIDNMIYNWNWHTDYAEVEEDGSMVFDLKSNFSFGGGVHIPLSSNFGLILGADFCRQKINTLINYEYLITWWDNDKTDDGLANPLETESFVTSIPLNLDIVYTFNLGYRTSVNIFGGLSVFFVKTDLASFIGWADIGEDENYYYPDFYMLEMEIYQTETLFGGNAGISIEYKMGDDLSLYAGGTYYYTPSKTYRWEVVPYDKYTSVNDVLEMTSVPDVHEGGDVTSTLKLSFFKIFAGIKFYL